MNIQHTRRRRASSSGPRHQGRRTKPGSSSARSFTATPLHQPLDPADFAFMLAVLDRHEHAADKIGLGVKTIHVEEESE